MRAQYDGDAPLLDVSGDNRKARVAGDQLAQTAREEIVKAGNDDGDRIALRLRHCLRANGLPSTDLGRWVSRVSPFAPPRWARSSPSAEEESGRAAGQGGEMARLLLAMCAAATLLLTASGAAQAVKPGRPTPAAHAGRHRIVRQATPSSVGAGDPAAIAAALAERYWGATPCDGQIALKAAQPLPAEMEADTDGWVTFESALGPNDLQAPADGYTQCMISLARRQWPTKAAMADDWNMFCLTVVHEMGHLLGHQHSLTPGSVMAPVFVDESSVPAICSAVRAQVEAKFG